MDVAVDVAVARSDSSQPRVASVAVFLWIDDSIDRLCE